MMIKHKEFSHQTSPTAPRGRGVLSSIRAILSLSMLLAASLSSPAANWYVDNVATGSKNGTSWANAWTSFTQVVWGTGGVQPGDTLYISGGTTSKKYTATSSGLLTIGNSGTATSRITIRVGQDPGHNGNVILDGAGYSPIVKCYRNYITLDGGYNGQIHLTVTNASQALDTTAMDFYNATDPRIYYVDVSTANIGIASVYIVKGEIAYCNVHDIRQECGIRLIGGNQGTATYDLTSVHNNTIQVNKLSDGSGSGPDGIQACPGLNFYSNYVYGAVGKLNGTGQHQDLMQLANHYIKIYNNVFENGADSLIDQDTMSNDTAGYLQIYNNVFRRTDKSGTVAIRCYNSYGWALSWIKDLYIDNNTFIDGAEEGVSYGVAINLRSLSPAQGVQNVHIRNNIIYNCGNSAGTRPVLWVSGFSPSGWDIDYNLINPGAHGTTILKFDGYADFTQAHGQSGSPGFVSYAVGSTANDLRLATTDTAAQNKATTLTYFSNDKNNVPRPQGGAWDIGAYEVAGTGTSTPVITVTPTTQSFGNINVGTTADLTFVVQNTGSGTLTGSATVGSPFGIVSGSPYNLNAGQSQTVTVRYSPTVAGTNSQNVVFTGGSGATRVVQGSATVPATPIIRLSTTALDFGSVAAGSETAERSFTVQNVGTGTLTGSATVSAPFSVISGSPYSLAAGQSQTVTVRYTPTMATTNLQNVTCSGGGSAAIVLTGSAYFGAGSSIPATMGLITAPFAVTSNYISQATQTTLAAGGKATYSFTVTNDGSYVLQAIANTPSDGENSLFVNIDADPQDPTMIWDMPISSGFTLQTASWRGSGTFDKNQYAPKVFQLTKGTHKLVIVAREANTQIQAVSIVPLPAPPKNVRVISF